MNIGGLKCSVNLVFDHCFKIDMVTADASWDNTENILTWHKKGDFTTSYL